MEKKSFLLYFDSYPWVKELRDEEKGRLLDALFAYAAEAARQGTAPDVFLEGSRDMAPETWMAFGFMAGNIYRDTMKWRRAQETKAARRIVALQEPLL